MERWSRSPVAVANAARCEYMRCDNVMKCYARFHITIPFCHIVFSTSSTCERLLYFTHIIFQSAWQDWRKRNDKYLLREMEFEKLCFFCDRYCRSGHRNISHWNENYASPRDSINRLAFMVFNVAPVPDACECLWMACANFRPAFGNFIFILFFSCKIDNRISFSNLIVLTIIKQPSRCIV